MTLFWGSIAVIWLLTLGYLLVLTLIVRSRRHLASSPRAEPGITVVIPTLNEEALINEKIADIHQTDYPQDKIDLVIVDGGSDDGTVKRIKGIISEGLRIRLFQLAGTPSKAEQINHALRNTERDVIVFSDADSKMTAPCIGELVAELMADPRTAIMGATVRPRTGLLAERIHWLFLNNLWWLEGEVFGAAGVSGVCFAVRRSAMLSLGQCSKADDIRLGLEAGASGYRVRLSRRALATETRVPQTVRQFIQFRRRRGSCYAHELLRFPGRSHLPGLWRLLRFIRLWQFMAMPIMATVAILSGFWLAASRYWSHVLLAGLLFLVPTLLYVFDMAGEGGEPRQMSFVPETIRFLIIFLISLFAIRIRFSGQGAQGGKRE